MLEWMHDERTKEIFATDFASLTRESVENFIKGCEYDTENVNFVCVDDADKYLGTVSLKHIDKKAANAEYAVSFCYDSQGTGAASFATNEILKYAFETIGLERVYLNVIPQNKRANAFYEKMGFEFEGEFRKHVLVNGKLSNLCWYSMLKDEYFKNKQ